MTSRPPSRIPVRGAIGLGVTAAGLAFLLSLRPPAAGGELALALDITTDDGTPGVSSPPATAQASPTGSASAAASPTASAEPVTSATPAATAATEPITATGDAVSFRYGTVQVQVTVENGTITQVVALQLPDGDRRSANISQQVEPWLAEEAVAAQSASIDIISGATYTSRAYAQSLQSALDQLAA